MLFSIFIDDVCEVIEIPHLLYADDLVIYTSGDDVSQIIEVLQKELYNIDEWCRTNQVKINYDKTEFMIFHKPNDKSGISCEKEIVIEGIKIK